MGLISQIFLRQVSEIREKVHQTIDDELKKYQEMKVAIKKIKRRIRHEKAGNKLQHEVIEEAKIEEAKEEFDNFRERQRLIKESLEVI